MKGLDVLVVLAFVAVDDLRNAVIGFLTRADELTLVALLAIALVLYKSQAKVVHAFDFGKWFKSLKIF